MILYYTYHFYSNVIVLIYSLFLRKLKSFDVSKKILLLIYKSLIESILSFNVITFKSEAKK